MCRHICPIGNATGLERNTARARALGLSLVNRNTFDLSEVIDNVYECACCAACTKECVTGWDPVMFIKDARRDAALNDKLPEYIGVLVDNCLETGNAYGKTEIDSELKAEISKHSALTDTLLFLGVDARYIAPAQAVKAIKAFDKAGIKFTVLENEPASAQQLEYLVADVEETKEQMNECAEALENFKTVIAFDPQDASVFKRAYKEYGVELKPQVKTFTSFVSEKLDAFAPKKSDKHAVYQDPFRLARDLSETEEARKIISAYFELDEMLMHGKDTMWAGNILMAQWMPDVMLKVAEDRINNARGVKADRIVTASVSEYVALRNVEQNDVEIVSLEELLLG